MADFGIGEAGLVIAGSTVSWGTVAATSAAVAGAALTTYAQIQNQNAMADQARSEAKAASIEADSRRQAAVYDEAQFRRKAALLLGQQQAQIGASGLDPSVGSPLLETLDTVRQTELEALNIRRTGEVGYQGAQYQSQLLTNRANYINSQKAGTIAGGVIQAGSSVLGGWARATPNTNPWSTWYI